MSNAVGPQRIAPSSVAKLEAERKQLLETIRNLSTPDAALAMPKKDRASALKRANAAYIDVLLELNTKVTIGLDGNEGFALLGENLQEGAVCFMKVSKRPGESKTHARRRAALQAYTLLLNKLGKRPEELPYVWQPT